MTVEVTKALAIKKKNTLKKGGVGGGGACEQSGRWFVTDDGGECLRSAKFTLHRRRCASVRLAAMRRVRTAGDALGGASPWRTTCPCPRRRPESEVLVGCSAASVSEASLAFYCVERSKQSQSGDTQRRYTTRHPDVTAEGPGWMWVRVPTRSNQV